MFTTYLLRGLAALLILFAAVPLIDPGQPALPALAMLTGGAVLLGLAQLVSYARDLRDLAGVATGGLEAIWTDRFAGGPAAADRSTEDRPAGSSA